MIKKGDKKISLNLEKMKKENFYLFCGALFLIFLFVGWLTGSGIKAYKIYQLKRYQARIEKEMEERLARKLENLQLRILETR